MASASVESLLEELLTAEEDGGRKNVDFVLQKRRVEETFEELLIDLKTLARVEVHLEEGKWARIEDVLENRTNYDAFRELLKELDEHDGKKLPAEDDSISPFLRELIEKVQNVADKSLLRPPSPPVTIKNRAEQETFRWARLIALQGSEMETLKRKITECQGKAVERQSERTELQIRSRREKDEQVNASHTAMVEMKMEGDAVAHRLQEEIANQPPFATLPEYVSTIDQHEQKRKRIAKLRVQLQLWIKKYDKFIGEPMPSLLELEQRVAGLEEWKENVLQPQEERLRGLRAQLEELEAIALEEKIAAMRKEHAVRVLQRAWKRTLELKKAKKSKKGKGKKR